MKITIGKSGPEDKPNNKIPPPPSKRSEPRERLSNLAIRVEPDFNDPDSLRGTYCWRTLQLLGLVILLIILVTTSTLDRHVPKNDPPYVITTTTTTTTTRPPIPSTSTSTNTTKSILEIQVDVSYAIKQVPVGDDVQINDVVEGWVTTTAVDKADLEIQQEQNAKAADSNSNQDGRDMEPQVETKLIKLPQLVYDPSRYLHRGRNAINFEEMKVGGGGEVSPREQKNTVAVNPYHDDVVNRKFSIV